MATNFSINLHNNIIIILVISVFLAVTSIEATANPQQISVNFVSDVGTQSEPVKITCKADGLIEAEKTLAAGQNFSFNPTKINDIYYCIALWRNYFASIQSFDPKRDAGQVSVFWKTDIQGLFFSYDGKSFELFAPWQTE